MIVLNIGFGNLAKRVIHKIRNSNCTRYITHENNYSKQSNDRALGLCVTLIFANWNYHVQNHQRACEKSAHTHTHTCSAKAVSLWYLLIQKYQVPNVLVEICSNEMMIIRFHRGVLHFGKTTSTAKNVA